MMELLEKVKSYIETLERRNFYLHLGILTGSILLVTIVIMFRHHTQVTYLKKQIDDINDLRETDVRGILTKAKKVQQQRAEVDAMLAEDEDFKIGGYFKDLLTELNLTNKEEQEKTSQIDRADNYRESILTAKFVDMSMQELTLLLSKIEQKKRIYSKELEIKKSKKTPKTLEVSITIATLQPKELGE